MSYAQNLGGFQKSKNHHLLPRAGQEQTPVGSHFPSYPEAGPSYPSYGPPSYDVATSPVPPPISGWGGLASHQSTNFGTRSFGGFGPSQMSQSPQPSQPPIDYRVASPSQPPIHSQSSSRFLDQAKSHLNARDPLYPPPPSFDRIILSPSFTTTYERLLQPFVIHGKPGKKYLDDAFYTTGTPALYKHDILAEDWVRFLEDIQIAGRLTGGQRVVANVLPLTMNMGLTGFFVTRAIESGMKTKKTGNVAGLLDIWNERFFHPRRLEVILCRGDYRESGNNMGAPAPDRPYAHLQQRSASGSFSSDSSSSGSSDSEDGHSNRGRKRMKSQRRMERRQRKHERREEHRARRSEKNNARKGNEQPYRLVVVSV